MPPIKNEYVPPGMMLSPTVVTINPHGHTDHELHTSVPKPAIDYEALPENSTLAANLMAGAFAGIMEHSVMFPVDLIKTRMQSGETNLLRTSIVRSATQIASTEGIRSLFKGLSSVILGAGPAHAVYFALYEFTKENLNSALDIREDGSHHPVITSISGAVATMGNEALMTPFDVMKQRMQLPGNSYCSLSSCFKTTFQNEGISAFYVSYPTTLAMSIPFCALNFTVYESSLRVLNPSGEHNPMIHCVSGGLAGAVAAFVTTPLDCIKTLLQTKGIAKDTALRRINSFNTAIANIYRRNGIMGFTRGWKPRVVANIPATAICWTSYEMAKFYLFKKSGINKEDF